MAILLSYDHVGVKDEVANKISNLAPQDFIFTAMIGKKKISNRLHKWQMDFDEPASENAYSEGMKWSDVDGAEAPTVMVENYSQKMAVAIEITTESEKQGYWAPGSQMDRQTVKKIRKLKRDRETAFLQNGKYVAPDVSADTPSKLGGFKSLVSTQDGGDTITGDPLTGQITYFTSDSTTPTEDDIFKALAALWITGAHPEILMVNNTMASTISGMQQEDGLRLKVFEPNDKGVNFEVNTITDPLGQTVKVIFNRYMPSNSVYIFNSEDWQEAVFRAPTPEDCPKDGDSKKKVIISDSGLEHRNAWASAVIVGKPEAAKVPLTGVTLVMSATTGTVGTALTSNATPTKAPTTATGVTYAYAMSAIAGLSCDAATGKVTGTPTAAGTATITVTATDDSATTKTGTATIVISAA